MIYIDFEEYTELGGILDLTAFNRNIGRVCGIIDNATKKRIEQMPEVPKQVKLCCRDLVEYISEEYKSSNKIASASQSALGASESISYVQKTKEDTEHDIDNILCDYLLSLEDEEGTPVLYRGLNI